jgi:hypothetical protein
MLSFPKFLSLAIENRGHYVRSAGTARIQTDYSIDVVADVLHANIGSRTRAGNLSLHEKGSKGTYLHGCVAIIKLCDWDYRDHKHATAVGAGSA